MAARRGRPLLDHAPASPRRVRPRRAAIAFPAFSALQTDWRSRSLAPALAVGLALLLGACSLGVTSHDDCTEDAQCQAAFGFGSSCGAEGLCVRAEIHPRCRTSFPADLLTSPENHRDTIVYGNLMDRSLATHQARERSAQLAITQANGADGVAGRRLGIVFCTIEENATLDGLSRVDAALATADFLVNDLGVPAIIGPSSSSDVQAVFTALRDTGALVISPAATSPALTDIDVTSPTDDNPGRLWRTAPPDSLQGAAIASDMSARAITNVAVIHAAGAYGEGLAAEFQASFTGEIDLFPFSNSTERDDAVTTAGAGSYDEVLFISSQTTDAAAFVNAAALLGAYDDRPIFLTDGAANADFLTMTRAAASARYPQVRGSRPSVPSGFVFDSFLAAYGAAYAGEDVSQFSFTAHAYDAAWMLVYGTAWALVREGGVVNGATIARGLRALSSGREFDVRAASLQPIVNAFMEGSRVDIVGASGDLDFDPATEETRAPIDIWVISTDGTAIEVADVIEP